MTYQPSFQPGPCPICGKPGGAFIHKSTWSYSGMCCGDKCGEAASAAIDAVKQTPQYKKAVDSAMRAQDEIALLKIKAIENLRK